VSFNLAHVHSCTVYSIVVNSTGSWEYPCGPVWLIISGHVIQFQYSTSLGIPLRAIVANLSLGM